MEQRPSTDSEPVNSEVLFRTYAGFVASFLYRLGAAPADIDDLVQDVFLTAHRRGGYRHGAASPTTFLARLAMEANLARRRQNVRWRRSQGDEAARATVAPDPLDPAQELALREAARKLQAGLDSIAPGPRAVFVLFELHGESCESIAAGLELNIGTVYSRLHAARRAFRASVSRASGRDEEEGTVPLGAVESTG